MSDADTVRDVFADPLAGVADVLRCPVCGGAVEVDRQAVRCGAGHAFDRARQGYASLIARPLRFHGDDAKMVGARGAVLESGVYDPLLRAVAAAGADVLSGTGAVPGPDGPVVVDLGCGTGTYLAGVLEQAGAPVGARGIGLDASKAAVRAAARAHPRVAALLGDAWAELPMADASADLIMSVFAPRNAAAYRRVLAPGGAVMVVAPEPGHLAELVDGIGLLRVDERKEERLAGALNGFDELRADTVSWAMRPTPEQVAAIVGMGPSARHLEAAQVRARIARLPVGQTVTGAVTVRVFGRTPATPLTAPG
ncbi:methyltransferase domain-containing protein [Tomitella fengzijianii]|uniref:methyltransferase domain-containing protein n=1 Tax=Tomitella fengzijianii TaxID=2597660 RepID=UPI00131E2556|nr:methyltransferase domain-containing protein [Tomitella fengzijianii]